jgi:hypothetical protein
VVSTLTIVTFVNASSESYRVQLIKSQTSSNHFPQPNVCDISASMLFDNFDSLKRILSVEFLFLKVLLLL